jgi:biopolymer transport protein ExbB/TolQ
MEFTIAEMWDKSGFIAKAVIIILGIMSIYVVGISFERLFVFFKAKKQSKEYAILTASLLEQKKFKEAADAAGQFKYSHIAKVVRAGLHEFVNGSVPEDSEGSNAAQYDVVGAVNRAIEKAGARMMASMRRGLGGLATVGSTAPFVGLFGTVFGIIRSFQDMPKGGGSLEVVGPGIAEALITTGAGIGVAVVGVLLYNYFTSRVDGLEVDINESALETVDIIIKQHEMQQAAENNG